MNNINLAKLNDVISNIQNTIYLGLDMDITYFEKDDLRIFLENMAKNRNEIIEQMRREKNEKV